MRNSHVFLDSVDSDILKCVISDLDGTVFWGVDVTEHLKMLRMGCMFTLNDLNLSGCVAKKKWSNSFHTSVSRGCISLILALAWFTIQEPQASSISRKSWWHRAAPGVNGTRFGLTGTQELFTNPTGKTAAVPRRGSPRRGIASVAA